MKAPPRTISSIGSNIPSVVSRQPKRLRAFTFIEIMATLAILTAGVVMIYKAFFLCLDYQNHLAFRLHASNILEHRIALTEQMLRDYKMLSFTRDAQQETVLINNQQVVFRVEIQIVSVAEASSLYQVDVSVTWKERKRDIVLNRSAIISSLTAIRKT